jgi:molecular chaperone DnaJ
MDLYVVLGVSRGATVSDVKRAYRRLARRYHPDINPGDRAAASLYQRISEAYETLVDPERRREYDVAGAEAQHAGPEPTFQFSGFDFSMSASGAQAATFTELFADVLQPLTSAGSARPSGGADLHATVTVSFVDAMRGVERQVLVTRQDVCGRCAGTGHVQTAEGRCAHCRGTGSVRWARGHMVFTKRCTACAGTGRQQSDRCPVCFGTAQHVRSEGVAVRIPPGIEDGSRMCIAARGHAGRNGGRPGDLYVTVHVQPHPTFRRIGDDIHVSVPVGVHEAVLGGRIEVPSLEGPLHVRIPAGTPAAQQVRVSGRGAPRPSGGRGDLVAEIQIVLPTAVDERSKELIREFGKLYGEIRTPAGS